VADEPLSITRTNYRDGRYAPSVFDFPPFALLPLWNARGVIDGARYGGGSYNTGLTGRDTYCLVVATPTQFCNPTNCNTAANRCVGFTMSNAFFAYDRPSVQIESWQGSLGQDKKDGAGTLYRRNRVYDPATGRFTQEDPIGLAGGMNLYGYANGNPLSYSDPFGLCKNARGEEVNPAECDKPLVDVSAGTFAVASGVFGIVRGAVGAGISAIGEALSARAATRATETVLFEGGKDALKQALSEGVEGINSQQARTLLKNLGEGSVDKIRIVTGENGLVSYSTRAGRNGYQTLARMLDESGNLRRMAQGAWDRAGKFVHGEVWK
jgi:RHS repeat-associated protein